jgi:hypothetical protein
MAREYNNPDQWQSMSFGDWTTELDKAVQAMVGCSLADLPDVCYADWFEDGVSPKSAARRAIRAARE